MFNYRENFRVLYKILLQKYYTKISLCGHILCYVGRVIIRSVNYKVHDCLSFSKNYPYSKYPQVTFKNVKKFSKNILTFFQYNNSPQLMPAIRLP